MNRKNLLHIILFLLVATLFFGCAKKEKAAIQEKEPEQVVIPKEGEIIEIQLSGSPDCKHELKLSDIAEEVSYIPLETNKDCLIGNNFSYPKFTQEFIFIESGGIVFQFDKQGKFVQKINKNGQGPGECYAREFAVCEKKELIYIFDNWNLSVYIFDFSAKHLKTIKNPFPYKKKDGELEKAPLRIDCDKEGNIFYIFENAFGDMKYKYVVMNENGEIIHKSYNYMKYSLDEDKWLRGIVDATPPDEYPIYKVGDDCYYSDSYNDTIFRINKDFTTSASYIINLPNRLSLKDDVRVRAGDINSAFLSNKNGIYGAREDKQYLYIYVNINKYSENGKWFFSRYDKKTKQLMENIKTSVKNDWDGGKDIVIGLYNQREDIVYTKLQPFKMKEMLADATNKKEAKFPEKQAALKELVDNMEEDDNPFIMIVKLK